MTPRVATFNYTPENRATTPLKDICSYAHAHFAKNNEKLWELENRGVPLIYGNRYGAGNCARDESNGDSSRCSKTKTLPALQKALTMRTSSVKFAPTGLKS